MKATDEKRGGWPSDQVDHLPEVDHLPANHHCPTIKCFSSLNCQLFVVELFSVPLIWIFLLRRPILKLTQHALLGWTIIQVQVSPCCIARLLNRAGLFNPLGVPTALLFTRGGSEHRSIKLCSADRQGCSLSSAQARPRYFCPQGIFQGDWQGGGRWKYFADESWHLPHHLTPHFRSNPGNVLRSSLKETWAQEVALIPWEIVYSPGCRLNVFPKCHLSLRKRMPQVPNGICIKVNSIC